MVLYYTVLYEVKEMTATEQKMEVPDGFKTYTTVKLEKNGHGGRPNLLQQLEEQGRDPIEELWNIVEYAWIKNRSIGSIARKYKVEYSTIYRILKDLEPSKDALIAYLEMVPRRKNFWNKANDTSDYETVQAYIRKAKRFHLKGYKARLRNAQKCWRFLKYKDPSRWRAEDVIDYLNTLKGGCAQSNQLDGIRKVCPQIRESTSSDYIPTGPYREKVGIRKKDLFGEEVSLIINALRMQGLSFHEIIWKLHITLGAREGKDGKAGITGLSWDRFKKQFTRCDLFESKVRGGIWSRNCPLDIFFKDLPEQLKELWKKRDKPITDKVILNGYSELLQIYKEIRKCLKQVYADKLEPSLFKELTTIRPHDSDKIHCNLLWEAKVPLEVVAGKYHGRGEGSGLFGRIWLDINTIKKHYLSLTERSERIQNLRTQVKTYSQRFNGSN